MSALRVFIHGSCVSRDTFEFMKDSSKVEAYVARQSFISAGTDAGELLASERPFESPFQERMRVADVHGDSLDRLGAVSDRIDLIVVDLCDERLGVFEAGPDAYVTDTVERRTRPPLKLRRIAFGTPEHVELWSAGFDRWLHGARRIAPRTPLLAVGLPWAESSVGGSRTPPSYGISASRANELYPLYHREIERLGVDVVGKDIPVLASEEHRWGLAPFHYGDDVYHALYQSLVDHL